MNNQQWQKDQSNAAHARQQRAQRSRRHRGTSNVKYARRPEGWREWLAALMLKRVFKHQSKAIPRDLRPWMPKNRGRWTVCEYRAQLKEAGVPAHQHAASVAQLKAVREFRMEVTA